MSAANDISALCSGAIESGNVERATIEVNGRQCSIKVSPSKIEGQQPQVKVSYASLASRQCQVKFTYDEKHISEQMEKFSEQMKISEFKGTITSIANYPDSPVKQENIDGRMGEIGKMLEGMRIFMQQNPVSEADMSILKAALNALASTPNLTMEDGKIHAISDCKDIATCRNVALQIEELQLLLYAKASGVGSIVALIVERLHQPIPKDQIGAQMGEIGKMLEDARIFVQQKPVSEAGMSVL
jgi:hypothetical protein